MLKPKPDAGNDDNKNKKGKCDYIKATLDQKLQELTDLEGKAKDKMKEKIKDSLVGAVLNKEEQEILRKAESAKAEYEKLKALYEECIIDVGAGSKTKTLKFRGFKADMILSGEKTATLRLFDDKNLQAGDELELINWGTKKVFAKAKITEVVEKKLVDMTEQDLRDHEPMGDSMGESLKEYYGDKVSRDTIGKIVRFELKK